MNAPLLRFKDENGEDYPEWETTNIKDLISESCIPVIAPSNNKLKVRLWGKGVCRRNNIGAFSSERSSTKFYRRKAGQLIYGKMDFLHGAFGIIPKELDGYVSTCDLPSFDISENIDNYFLLLSVLRPEFYLHNGNKADGTRKAKRVHVHEFLNMKISCPSLAEQKKIVTFFSKLDCLITVQRQKLESLEQIKKGFLHEIFSCQIRFKDKNNEYYPVWQMIDFVNLFEFINNNTLSRNKLNYSSGKAKNIHYGDVLVNYGEFVNVDSDTVPYINEDVDCSKYSKLKSGDIVIADTAEDETVGKATEIDGNTNIAVYSGLHTICCRPRIPFAKHYLGYAFNSPEFHNKIRLYMQGTKVVSISKSNLLKLNFLVPTLGEQQQIADFLDALSKEYACLKHKLSSLKLIKKALLQQMFI